VSTNTINSTKFSNFAINQYTTMKPRHFLLTGFLAATVLLLNSCASTNGVTMEVLVPANITVPSTIKKVAVVNRSLPAKGDGFVNFLEGFITGEAIHADKDASNKCIGSLVNKLNLAPRFGAVLVNYPQLKGTGTREWPLPLSWTMVDSICKMYKSDALVALETFDSDFLFDKGKNLLKQKTAHGADTIVTEYFANFKVNVNAGWRVYDDINKKVLDEQNFTDVKAWLKKGATPEAVLSQLPDKRDAINAAGLFAGDQYGMRISPTWENVYRNYYVRGKKEVGFKNAKKFVRLKKWDQAVIIWTNLSKSTDTKIAGRANYNLALASEMDGDLDKALSFATIARDTYGVRPAAYYVNQINARIADQARLKQQLGK